MSGRGRSTFAVSPLTFFGPKRSGFPVALLLQVFVGGSYVLIGLNGLLGVLPSLDPTSDLKSVLAAPCGPPFHAFVMSSQIVGGLCVLSGRYVNLGLLLLGPIAAQVLLFHSFVKREGLTLAIVMAVAVACLTWRNRQAWLRLVSGRAA